MGKITKINVEFICSSCGESFSAIMDEEKMMNEFKDRVVDGVISDTVMVCDSCYNKLVG